MPIPIHRLPILATKIIVDFMDKAELLCISLCSKRADWVLKVCNKKDVSFFNMTYCDLWDLNTLGSLELFLLEAKRADKTVLKENELNLKIRATDDDLSVEIVSEGNLDVELTSQHISKMDQYIGDRKDLRFGDTCVPTIRTDDWKVYTFWDQMTEGLLGLVNYLTINFKCSLDLDFNGDGPTFLTNVRKITQYAMQPQVIVGDASITTYQDIPDEDFKFVLESLKLTGRFEIAAEVGKNFKFNGSIQAPCLRVTGCSAWFTLRHLLKGDYEKVHIGFGIKYPDVTWFLEEWMAGKFPKLKELSFEMDTHLDEITLPEGWTNGSVQYTPYEHDSVHKYDGVVGGRNVTAEIYSPCGSKTFGMDVQYEELVEEEAEHEEESDDN